MHYEESEKGPGAELNKLEWEINTESRGKIKEDAEAQGLLCSYPDGA